MFLVLNYWEGHSNFCGKVIGCSFRHKANALERDQINVKECLSRTGLYAFSAPLHETHWGWLRGYTWWIREQGKWEEKTKNSGLDEIRYITECFGCFLQPLAEGSGLHSPLSKCRYNNFIAREQLSKQHTNGECCSAKLFHNKVFAAHV